jgi:SSS family solute:Na+ symporter
MFIQDVIAPLRRKRLEVCEHIFLLRLSIIGVALFAFFFGIFFHQTQYLVMWFHVTTALYVGGAGAAVIGGLYWKKGTAAGAWCGMLVGSGLSVAGIFANQLHPGFVLNGIEVSFFASLIAIVFYVGVSLLTCRQDFNMERMLHRGAYALSTSEGVAAPKPAARKFTWGRLIGANENFTRGDFWITGGLTFWALFWFVVMIVGSIWNWSSPWPLSAWSTYWFIVAVVLPLLICVVTAVWFTWGGIRDIAVFFKRLRQEKVNALDDGTVVAHHNLGEPAPRKR